uniref:Uncharacterized protein n=1 Tax=Oryza brachyantha TaxID=4533 RepID=J3MCI1_ORYBR
MAWSTLAGRKTLPMVVLAILSMAVNALGERRQLQLMQDPAGDVLSYHGGAVLSGDIPVSIVWYGKFTPSQKDVVVDFVRSLTPTSRQAATPSAAQWWSTLATFYLSNAATGGGGGGGAKSVTTRVVLSSQVSDEAYSLGKTLTLVQIFQLAAGTTPKRGAVVLDPPLGAPNGDAGVDGMMVTLASMLAGAVTNPFGGAYYQGDRDAALEACTACAGVYGSGSYPGYAGKVLVDTASGGSYNAIGGGKRFLLPAIYNPATAGCSTTV